MQAGQLTDRCPGFMSGQDVRALLWRGGAGPAQDFALLLRPLQSRLGALNQQIPLQFSDGRQHSEHHLPRWRSQVQRTQLQDDDLDAAGSQKLDGAADIMRIPA